MSSTFALLLLAAGTQAAQFVVETGSAAGWMTNGPSTPITADVGDTIVFNYATHHDVIKMVDANALAACTPTGNTELANSTESPYTYTVTAADQTAGAAYFSCSWALPGTYSHCSGGNMKLTVTVNPAGAPATPSPTTAAPTTSATGTNNCSGTMLLATTSGPDSSCPDSSPLHHWPLSSNAAHCHGWKATDRNGKVHRNSASNIRCSTNGREMLYDQYGGNLDCGGSAVAKEFSLDECSEGIPAGLFDRAVNLDCCSNPEACLTGTPSVENAGATDQEIYSDGQLCVDTAATTAAPGSSAATTKSVVAVTVASIFGGLFFF